MDRGVTVRRDMEYPSGSRYLQVLVGGRLIGGFDILDDGFLPWGCRNPVATERDAVESVLRRHVKSLRADANRIDDALSVYLSTPSKDTPNV